MSYYHWFFFLFQAALTGVKSLKVGKPRGMNWPNIPVSINIISKSLILLVLFHITCPSRKGSCSSSSIPSSKLKKGYLKLDVGHKVANIWLIPTEWCQKLLQHTCFVIFVSNVSTNKFAKGGNLDCLLSLLFANENYIQSANNPVLHIIFLVAHNHQFHRIKCSNRQMLLW